MGQILSQPVTDKFSDTGENDRLYFGMSSMQGWRVTMEDAHAAELNLKKQKCDGQEDGHGNDKNENNSSSNNRSNDVDNVDDDDDNNNNNSSSTNEDDSTGPKIAFFGVYDGHGGDKTAFFTGGQLHNIVAKQPSFPTNLSQALKDGFLSTDHALLTNGIVDSSGCAATTAVVTDDRIVVANAGDSRTVLGVKGIAKPLSFDHKPQNAGEKSRIVAAGGFVEVGRVNGNLALSRAIGDFDFKRSANLPPEEQIVTAYPDVIEHEITGEDEFLILACDGIWDCMHSQDVVEFVRRGIAAGQELHEICENLMDNCLAPASDISGVGCDNMTVLIVALLNGKTKQEWYDMVRERVKNGEGPVAPESSAQLIGNRFDNRREVGGESRQRRGGADDEDDDEFRNHRQDHYQQHQPELSTYLEHLVSNGAYVLQGDETSTLLSNYFGLSLGGQANGPVHTVQEVNEDEEVEEADEGEHAK